MPEMLQNKLAAVRRRWRSLQVGGGLALTFSALASLSLFSFYCDRLLVLSTAGRWAWLIALVVSALVMGAMSILLPLLRPLSDEAVAIEVERRFPILGERLLTTVELAHAGAGAGVSGALISSLASETARVAEPLPFEEAISIATIRKPALLALAAAFLLLIHILWMPEAMGVWLRRILMPGADVPIFAYTQVWVVPGDTVVPRGEDAPIGVLTEGRAVNRATLHYHVEGSDWAQLDIKKPQIGWKNAPSQAPDMASKNAGEDARRFFPYNFRNVQQDITYYATAGDGRSNPHTIRVEDRPTLLNLRLHLDYPDYTGRPSDILTATGGNVVAPVGTRVHVEATANKPLTQAIYVEEETPRGHWKVRGETVIGSFVVRRDLTYGLNLRDEHGFEAIPAPRYTIRAKPDQPPAVRIVKPSAEIECTPNASVHLQVVATDDYGVHTLHMAYRIDKRAGTVPLPLATNTPPTNRLSVARIHLAPLRLKPGDILAYEAVARDGDTITRPHTGRSATHRIHIIGTQEMQERLEQREQEEREAIRRLIQRQQEAQKVLAQARRNPTNRALAEQAAAIQQEVAKETADLARSMQETTQRMQENNLARPSEMQRREEVRQSLQNLAQQAMPRAADTIQRAAETQRAQMLTDAAQQEQAIQEELERLARQTAPTPSASQLAEQAERLAQEQQRLAEQADLAADQTNHNPPSAMTPAERKRLQEMARRQAELRAKTQALGQQIERAAREAQERGKPEQDDLQRALQQMHQSGITAKQSTAQRNLQEGKPSDASPLQMDAAQDLQNLANSLDHAGQAHRDAQAMQRRINQLNALLEQLEKMTADQLNISGQTRRNPSTETMQNLAEREQELERQAREMAPKLQDVPPVQQNVQRAERYLQRAAEMLRQHDSRSAYAPQRDALRQLLQAAMDLRNAIRNMEMQQSSTEMQEIVRKLARDQRNLAGETRRLSEVHRKGILTPDQRKRLDALTERQKDLLNRAENLSPDMPSPAFQWALGEASRRMENAVQGMQQQNDGPDTQRHQLHAAQILERLARALGQQAQAMEQQSQQSGSPQGSGAQQQMAEALGELQLAREIEAQIRQETGSLDQRRLQNPGQKLSAEQLRELSYLHQAQRETQRITQRAAEQLRTSPQIAQGVQRAAEEMEEVQDLLRAQETGKPTQTREERIVRRLDQSLHQIRQAMRQQQRQQMAQQRRQQQSATSSAQQQPGGNQPALRTTAPVVEAQPGVFHRADQRGRGFGGLPPRAQEALREGQQEGVPVEYRELVKQYYKALSERGK